MNDHGARLHSVYGASSAHRYFVCPGSIRASRGIPDRPSPYAAEGTQAHELLEAMLNVGAGDGVGMLLKLEAAPLDMRARVREAVDEIHELMWPGDTLITERPFEIPSAVAPGEIFGTCDVIIVSPVRRMMIVWDFKYGAGVPVEAYGNLQTRFYGLGALLELQPDIDTAELHIYQPRAAHDDGPARHETVSVVDLMLFHGEIEEAVKRAQDPNVPRVPGTKQCQFCPANLTCPERQEMLRQVGHSRAVNLFGQIPGLEAISAQTMVLAHELSPERIAHIVTIAPMVRAYLKDVEAHAHDKLSESASSIPLLKLVESQARRRYNLDEATTADRLYDLAEREIARDDFFRHELKPLTETEAMLVDHFKSKVKKGNKKHAASDAKEAMALLTTKDTNGKLSVVPITDPRPPSSRALASFGSTPLLMIEPPPSAE